MTNEEERCWATRNAHNKERGLTRVISHRGHLAGPDPVLANNPKHIEEVLWEHEFDAEVDVWKVGDQWWLGHVEPINLISVDWLYEQDESDGLWIHCKNREALMALSTTGLRFFWHENDQFALTSQGDIWNHVHNKQEIKTSRSVISRFDVEQKLKSLDAFCGGICTDYPIALRERLYVEHCNSNSRERDEDTRDVRCPQAPDSSSREDRHRTLCRIARSIWPVCLCDKKVQ